MSLTADRIAHELENTPLAVFTRITLEGWNPPKQKLVPHMPMNRSERCSVSDIQ